MLEQRLKTGTELSLIHIYGSVVKNKEAVNIRFAFCFPDMYDVGMSHLGMKILYHMMNDTMPDVWCERVLDVYKRQG